MALKIRLARGGAKKKPFYRIVVADVRSPRDGRFIEKLGTYDPFLPHEHPERIVLKQERITHWLKTGAKPTERVAKFLGKAGLIEAPAISERPKKSAPKAKAQERLREQEEARKAAAEAAEEAKAAAEAEAAEAAAAAEEAPAEEPAAEAAPADDAPADEAPADEAPADEPAAEDAPAEDPADAKA